MSVDITNIYHVGQRCSLKNQSCTIRYIGPVADKAGIWLGVEWDNPSRGKHDGTFDGVIYFTCRSRSSTAASFLKPTQTWDQPRSFLEALREKYMPKLHQEEAEIVYISGKQAEEVGFEKFSQRQSKLQGIHVLVLDHMRIDLRGNRDIKDSEEIALRELCAEITELDVSGNLFEDFGEILQLCSLMPKLKTLTLDANRFSANLLATNEERGRFPPITTLKAISLSRTLLDVSEVEQILSFFPSLESFTFADNEVVGTIRLQLSPLLSTLDISDNEVSDLSSLGYLSQNCPRTLILKRNRIQHVTSRDLPALVLPVTELDLTYNLIQSWTFFNSITRQTFPSLRHLRVTGNPLYRDLVSTDGKPLSAEDGYMLTIARLPQLEYLNYARISEKERLNAETYYLGQIAVELSKAAAEGLEAEAEIIARHPRYRELCEEYGEPMIQQRAKKGEDVDPNSLAARLVNITFTLAPDVFSSVLQQGWTEEVPKSLNVYSLLGIVGKRLGAMPLSVRLVLETNEQDPVGRDAGYTGPEWWDSSDEEDNGLSSKRGDWVNRETEIVAGTRAIGTYIEGRIATVKIEKRDRHI